MRDHQITQNPWWKTTATVIASTFGFIGLIVGLAPLISLEARQWYKEHWFIGWTATVVVFLVSTVAFVILRNQQKSPAPVLTPQPTPDPSQRTGECASDVALVDRWLGLFMSDGEVRLKLEEIPNEKVFSRDLSFALNRLSQALNDSSKEVFDPELRKAIEEVKDSFEAYWGSFEILLDGPGELIGDPWDLKIITPPGGNWIGENESQQWDSFYRFVRKLWPLKTEFLNKVAAVEKITHRLRIEVRLPART